MRKHWLAAAAAPLLALVIQAAEAEANEVFSCGAGYDGRYNYMPYPECVETAPQKLKDAMAIIATTPEGEWLLSDLPTLYFEDGRAGESASLGQDGRANIFLNLDASAERLAFDISYWLFGYREESMTRLRLSPDVDTELLTQCFHASQAALWGDGGAFRLALFAHKFLTGKLTYTEDWRQILQDKTSEYADTKGVMDRLLEEFAETDLSPRDLFDDLRRAASLHLNGDERLQKEQHPECRM